MKGVMLLIFAIGLTKEQCSTGCLKCSSSNACLLCDTAELYYLSQNTCVLYTRNNCGVIDQSGNCVMCKPGYYLDQTWNGCVIVSVSALIPNCLQYNSGQACTKCLPNCFIASGGCSIVTSTIPFCQSYIGNGVCESCQANYIFSPDYLTCVPLQKITNCQSYGYLGCKKCVTNFIYNQNLFSLNYNDIEKLVSLLSQTPVLLPNTPLLVCQATSILNCASFSAFNICTACVTGYYLLNNVCFSNPVPRLANCLAYTSTTICKACKEGFYLSGGVCTANQAIPNCQVYDNAATSNTCVRCNQNTYLLNNGCTDRTVSLTIMNCQTPSLNSDKCSQCISGYSLTTDGLGCLQTVTNCVVYAASVATQAKLSCTLCSPGYYTDLDGSSCTSGTIANCQVYTSNSNTCVTCNHGFYKSGDSCLAHISIPNCLQYSQTSANQCLTCTTGFYSFLFHQICVAVVSIPYCAQYSADGLTCLTCMGGYYRANPNSCLQIPNSYVNCLNLSNSICTGCQIGYFLNLFSNNNVCTPYVDYVMESCDTASIQNPNYCSVCPPNFYYYVPQKNEAICVLGSDFLNFASYPSVSQCARYGLNSASPPVIVCMECGPGFFLTGYWPNRLMATSTSCISSCSTADGTNVVIPDDLYGSVNICVQNGSGASQINWLGCQRLARYTTYNDGQLSDYNCLLPTSVYSPVFQTSAATPFIYESNASTVTLVLNGDTANNSVDFAHGFSFLDVDSVTPQVFNYRGVKFDFILSSVVNPQTTLTNCDMVFQLGSAGSVFQSGGARSGGYAAASGILNSCLRCSYGYQPVFSITGASGNGNTPVCQSMGSACLASTIIYGGLPSFLNAAVSCHSCATLAGVVYYPTLYMEYDATTANGFGVFLQYALPAITNSAISSNHGFRCAVIPTTVAISASTPNSGNSVAQCAVYGTFSAQVSGNTTPSVSNTFCLACASGFYPIYLAASGSRVSTSPVYAPPYTVTTCIRSNKCDLNSPNLPFNSCGKCTTLEQTLSPPGFYAYSDYRLINCLPVSTPNCLIISPASPSTATVNACLICQSGFYLNFDMYCDRITFPNFDSMSPFVFAYFSNKASSFTGSLVVGFDIAWSRIHYILSFSGLQYGARNCLPEYVRAPASSVAPGLCVNSAYLEGRNFLPGTKFITNCLKFNFGLAIAGVYSCKVCVSGFIPTSTNLQCVTKIANCLQALSSNAMLCNLCQTGYFNLGGVCSVTTIPNCTSYLNTVQYNSGLPSLTCNACVSGNYLRTSSQPTACLPGSILNCATYSVNSGVTCLACMPSFNLVLLGNSINYCYPVLGAFSNCQMNTNNAGTANIKGFKQGYINCGTCSQTGSTVFGVALWSSLPTTNQPQSICMPFSPISNCATYDQGNIVFGSNSFACNSCIPSFYYQASSNSCISRQNKDPNCLELSVTSDQCVTCGVGYFLNTVKTACIIYPFGIPFCSVYSSATTCVTCAINYYLSNNACLLSTLISNCVSYSANATCTSCAVGNFLSNNECGTSIANGCVTYANISACASCAPGFGLLPGSNSIDCVQTNIENCIAANSVFPFVCLTCQTGYYPDSSGTCSQVSETITNCLVYDTSITCSQCISGAALSAAKNFCDTFTYAALVDPNCVYSYVATTPICVACSLGSSFINGSCVSNIVGVLSGCLTTNPLNLTNCLICKSGHYQVASGACLPVLAQGNANLLNNTNYNGSCYRMFLKLGLGLLSIHLV